MASSMTKTLDRSRPRRIRLLLLRSAAWLYQLKNRGLLRRPLNHPKIERTHVRSLARLALRLATLDALRPSRTLSGRRRRGYAGACSDAATSPQCLCPDRRSRRARLGEGLAGALADGRAAVAARRRADLDQGHHAGQGLADALRLVRHRRDGGDR